MICSDLVTVSWFPLVSINVRFVEQENVLVRAERVLDIVLLDPVQIVLHPLVQCDVHQGAAHSVGLDEVLAGVTTENLAEGRVELDSLVGALALLDTVHRKR